MRKHFYFSAMICVLLSVFVFSADAGSLQGEDSKWKVQDDAKTVAQNKAMDLLDARSVMSEMRTYYNLNAQKINEGKRLTLGSVLKGAATVTVTYISGGSTLSATVIATMEPALRSLGLLGSINVQSDLESAYEAAISEVQSRISDAKEAIKSYKIAWNTYNSAVLSHNAMFHSGPNSYYYAHTASSYLPPPLDEGLPSFSCPDGSCGLTWLLPSTAREAHYARCGTLDDPYNTWLKGCYKRYYTCNSSDKARHKPKDCGLSKWIETTHGWTETPCPGDYRKCTQTQTQRLHSTLLTGVNVP